MSLNFKIDLKEMRENDPAGEERLDKDYQASENYDTPGLVRNLCFVWPDGRMKFMNYAYLVSGEYLPDKCVVSLIFTTEEISLHGVWLEPLFEDILEQKTKRIMCIASRYIDTIENKNIVIKGININRNTS